MVVRLPADTGSAACICKFPYAWRHISRRNLTLNVLSRADLAQNETINAPRTGRADSHAVGLLPLAGEGL